ncbi:hypothetical protein D3C76_1787020 [compost metagenome]
MGVQSPISASSKPFAWPPKVDSERVKDPTMIKKMPLALLGVLVSLSGCAKDRSLSPPADSEQMTIDHSEELKERFNAWASK